MDNWFFAAIFVMIGAKFFYSPIVVRHIKTENNETDYTNNFIDFINFL